MDNLNVQAPDGNTLTVKVPEGTDPKQYDHLADDALSHYSANHDGAFTSFMHAVENQMPLGSQFTSLVSPGKYSDNMAAISNNLAQNNVAHPIASGAGSITGAVGPALIPGVGELIAANPMTAGAALGATGAVANTDIQKNPVEAAQQAAMGGTSGALLSGLLGKIMPSAQGMEARANNLANKSVNLPSGVLGDMTEAERQAQGSALRDAGVIVKDKQEALAKAEGLLKNYGQKIRSVANTTEGQGLVADPSQHYSAITDLLNKAQEFEGMANKASKAIGRDYKAGASDLANLPDNPSWNDIQSLKQKYGSFAFKENATQGAKDTYFALSNMLKGIADKAQSNPDLGTEYKKALAGYSQMSPIVDGLNDAVDSELRGNGAGMGVRGVVGLIKKLPGEARAVVGAGALATGHPLYAAMAAIPELMNPAIQSQAAGMAAKVAPALQASATRAVTSPQAQQKIISLIQQLKAKYDARR